MAQKFVITDVGLEALINAQQTGTNPLTLASVQFGSGKYEASTDQTALVSPFKTLTTLSGGATGDNMIHITVRDGDEEEYTVYEVGVFTDGGVLFAVYSQDTSIITKATTSVALLSLDFIVTQMSEGDIVINGDTNFWNPMATTETAGVVQIATASDVSDGTDAFKSVTPATLASLLTAMGLKGTVGSDTIPTWVKNGVLTALGGTAGSNNQPVWLSNGELTTCRNVGYIDYQLGVANSYVRFQNGLIIEWGAAIIEADTSTDITLPISVVSPSNCCPICVRRAETAVEVFLGIVLNDNSTLRVTTTASNDIGITWIVIGY